MYKVIDTILLIISSTIAVQLNSYLINQKQNEFLSLAAAAVIAAVFHEVAKGILLELPLRISRLRPILKPESRVEGYWMSRVIDYQERPYSFITIEYNVYAKKYIYSGSNFDINGNIGGSWKSTQVEIDIENEKMWFLYEAKVHDKTAETPQGYGVIDFEKDGNGKYTRAKGLFIDAGVRFIKSNFFMNRLNTSDFEKLINKKTIQTNEDMSALIRAYHQSVTQNEQIKSKARSKKKPNEQ